MSQQEFHELNPEVWRIWDNNADFWDSRMGEGNDFHRLLVALAQERLLAVRQGEVVLDVACGNGQFARKLAELGAHAVAFDIAPRMIAACCQGPVRLSPGAGMVYNLGTVRKECSSETRQ